MALIGDGPLASFARPVWLGVFAGFLGKGTSVSGIAGIFRFDGGPVETGLIETMVGGMAHRGPDGTSCWRGEGAALGHCMKSRPVQRC